jgi:hypothetical protein
MTSNTRNSLFGGALLAAGLTTAASAQFSFSDSYIRLGAYAYGVSGPSYAYHYGAGNWSIAASEPYALATSDGTSTMIDLRTTTDPGGGAFSYAFWSFFTVGSTVTGTASWDWTNGSTIGYAFIENLTDGVNLLNVNAGAGSQPILLESGKEYFFRGWSRSFEAGGQGYTNLTIPAPGAAGLLGLAGLVAMRRRR